MAVLRGFTFHHLMNESERALCRSDSLPAYYRHPVTQLLDDVQRYQCWETEHARLMRYIAQSVWLQRQARALRETGLKLIHRRGFFDYLRRKAVRGEMRTRLFQIFYGPTDFRRAVLNEHRHFMIAASSAWCTEVLFDSLHDDDGRRRISRYEQLYGAYFELFGEFVAAELNDEMDLATALRPIMLRRRTDLARLRGEILDVPATLHPRRRWTDSQIAAAS